MPRLPQVLGLAALGLVFWNPNPAEAIPAFARRYKVSCALCHDPIPRLTAFGDAFAANGFRFASGEEPRDTIGTGDPLLYLANSLPLAMRLDAYAQAYSGGKTVADFGTPYIIKLLASGPLSKTFSYYMYVNLLERGEFGGFEDAVLIANDIWDAPVDVSVGQFQASDPMFKRELRLSFEDYALYRTRIGDEPANLTYDRGVMVNADVLGFGVAGLVLNGNGIGKVDEERKFDDGSAKNLMGYLSRDFGANFRLGALGYWGRSEADGRRNTLSMVGVDGTFAAGPLELNLQYIHRKDANPLFENQATEVGSDMGLVEMLIRPSGSRWHGFAVYNLVKADHQLLTVGLGEEGYLSRYETATGGLGYQVLRNLRATGEMMWNFQLEQVRWTAGFVTAF